jgi:glycosyltransferase involved in cell wall biosynthesis
LQDPSIHVPQYVVGWAYPTSLGGYLSKIGKFTGWKVSKEAVRQSLESIGWWRKDWRAYRSATSVLAVTQKLGADLICQGVRVHIVHPGTSICKNKPCEHDVQPCRLLIAAVDLEDPRKRVGWMIDALKSGTYRDYNLTLVGHASDAFKSWVCSDSFPAEFTGYLPRNQLQNLMAEHDIFLFGSCLDDWGYVLVEAMSQGLSIVAPDISPFDEIVGNAGILYSLNSAKELREKVFELSHSDLLPRRQIAWQRANNLFSRQAFGQSLVTAFLEKN